jgi:hypothetical protein
MNRMMAPLCGPHKSAGFAGEKAARVRGSVPLGAAMDSSAFSFPAGASTATTGAWPSPTASAGLAAEGAGQGSAIGIVAPVVAPRKRPVCRAKGLVSVNHPFGAARRGPGRRSDNRQKVQAFCMFSMRSASR